MTLDDGGQKHAQPYLLVVPTGFHSGRHDFFEFVMISQLILSSSELLFKLADISSKILLTSAKLLKHASAGLLKLQWRVIFYMEFTATLSCYMERGGTKCSFLRTRSSLAFLHLLLEQAQDEQQ
ncbi:hypothetical protein PRIC1_008991 [Phytophthora ramorum]